MANKVSGWFNSLLGKPALVSRPQPEESGDQESSKTKKINPTIVKPDVKEEDSVVSDIKNFKSFTKESLGKISTALKPYAKKGSEASSTVVAKAGGLVDKNFLRQLIRIFLILFFLLVLIFVGIRLFKVSTNGENGDGGGGGGVVVTPTPIDYQPYRPSIYNDDPEIKKLEEDISVLQGEMSSTNLRETDLNPPNLDFNISF